MPLTPKRCFLHILFHRDLELLTRKSEVFISVLKCVNAVNLVNENPLSPFENIVLSVFVMHGCMNKQAM